MWAALNILGIWVILCILGAFLGAEKARQFFNSPALAVFWVIVLGILIAGLGVYRSLIRRWGLLAMHTGCILILLGGLWGSDQAQRWREKHLGDVKIPHGKMMIEEGKTTNEIYDDLTETIRTLPFSIRLDDFSLLYYEPGTLTIQDARKTYAFPASPGAEYTLDGPIKIRILRTFGNFKIVLDNNQKSVIDSVHAGINPAVEIEITNAQGQTTKKFIFERFGDIGPTHASLRFQYRLTIRDYLSVLAVIDQGQIVGQKTIEVNHPLHYGGYHFYQHSYDDQAGSYTVLKVVSDSGLNLVYTGFGMLLIGVVSHFWLRPLRPSRSAYIY